MNRRSRGTGIAGVLLIAGSLLAACVPQLPSPTPAPTTPGPAVAGTPRIPTPVPTAVVTPAPSATPGDLPTIPPPSAGLVLRHTGCGDTCGPSAGTTILDDGRIIFEDLDLKVFEARLTSVGIDRVRAAIDEIAALAQDGSFSATLRPGHEPLGHGAGAHQFELGTDDDRIVISTVDSGSFADQEDDWIIPPEARQLTAFAGLVSEPVRWLGEAAFAEPPRPYVPPGYVVTVEAISDVELTGNQVDVDDVAWPFGGPIEAFGDPLPAEPGERPNRCFLIDRSTGVAMLAAEATAGFERDFGEWNSLGEYDWARGDGWVFVHLLPLLPHQAGTCAELLAETP